MGVRGVWRAGWGLVGLLLCQCGEAELPTLRLVRVTPDHAALGQSAPVVISGRGFLLDVHLSLLDDEAQRLNANFQAQLGGVPLLDVRYGDARNLTGIIPGLLLEGTHAMQVTDARGRTMRMPDAFRVEPPPWWDPTWSRRRRLLVDNSTLAEPLEDFPVLVRLDAAWFDYSAVAPGGSDLRLVAADGTTMLDHELESFDPGGESLIWVRLPRIEIPPAVNLAMLYYGNAQAGEAANASGVWRNGFAAVYHLPSLVDSTGRLPAAVATGATPAIGVIGGARSFDGDNDLVDLGDDLPLLQSIGAATLSAWVNPRSGNRAQVLIGISRGDGGGRTNESRATLFLSNGRRVTAAGRSTDAEGLRSVETPTNVVSTDEWQWLAAVIDYTGDRVAIWRDGVGVVDEQIRFTADATPMTPARNGALAAEDDGQSGFFGGALDEIRVAATGRSAAWLEAEYRSMTDGLVSVGPEELLP